MEIKNLIESLILDLADNGNIVSISRKAQVVANLLGNAKFSSWVSKEFVNGYTVDDEMPEYRKIEAIDVCGTYIVPHGFGGAIKYSNVSIPIQNLGSELYKEIVCTRVYETLSIIQQSIPGKDNIYGSLTPNQLYYIQSGILQGCQIFYICKVFSKQDYMKIVDFSTSHLLEMLLKINKDIFNNNIDFGKMSKHQQNEIINNIYNATIVHTGNGEINIDNSNVVSKDNHVTIEKETLDEIKSIVQRIEQLEVTVNDDEKDMAQYILEIQQEINSKMPQPAVIKRALRALKSFKVIIGQKTIEYGIDKILTMLTV